MATEQPLSIVLVEDDDVDAMAFQRHVGRSSIPTQIHRAVDGVEALTLLRDRQLVSIHSTVIVLDLNMPRMNGQEFLAELRGDPQLKSFVVFVLTTSDAESDLRASYEKNVAGYVLKSGVGEKFEKMTELLSSYYKTVEFPPDVH